MISETAIEALDELVAKGLQPTPRDVVRLNAAGLKLEAAGAKRLVESTYALPRIAAVSKDLFFRQPTVGHEIWMDKVRRFVEDGDFRTTLALHCFALSRPQEDLPDADSPDAVATAVRGFLSSCAQYTRDQLFAAVRYCMFGADPAACESTASPPSDADADEDAMDITECIALGVLNEGRAVLWGLSEADMRRMTPSELAAVIDRAYDFHKMQRTPEEDHWQGRFYATLDEIAARLEKEKANGAAA